MRFIKIPFLLLWRLWFYILLISTILLMLPLLLILTSKESYYPAFWKVLRTWSFVIIYGMGFRLKISRDQELDKDKSYMFTANHASFIDPWVMIVLSKNPIVFVGKKELVKFPIFGFFYKKSVIMVDRTSQKSKRRVYEMAKRRLQHGTSIAIFPEGLVPAEEVVLAPFKNGAFALAIQQQIPIVPQVYYDCKRLFSWDFFKGGPGVLRVHQHAFIETRGLEEADRGMLKQQLFDLIHSDLINDEAYMKGTNSVKTA